MRRSPTQVLSPEVQALLSRLRANDAKLIDINTTFYSKNFTDADAIALAQALEHNTSLINLVIYSKQISVTGITALAKVLERNTTLTFFGLYGSSVSDIGVEALAKALKHNNTLTRLELRQNQISDIGATALANTLEHNTTLTRLDLSENGISDTLEKRIEDYCERNRRIRDQSDQHDVTDVTILVRENIARAKHQPFMLSRSSTAAYDYAVEYPRKKIEKPKSEPFAAVKKAVRRFRTYFSGESKELEQTTAAVVAEEPIVSSAPPVLFGTDSLAGLVATPTPSAEELAKMRYELVVCQKRLSASPTLPRGVADVLSETTPSALQESLRIGEAQYTQRSQQMALSKNPLVYDYYFALQFYLSQTYAVSMILEADRLKQRHGGLDAVGSVIKAIPMVGGLVNLLKTAVTGIKEARQLYLSTLISQLVPNQSEADVLFEAVARLFCIVHLDTLSQSLQPDLSGRLVDKLKALRDKNPLRPMIYEAQAMKAASQCAATWMNMLCVTLRKDPAALQLRERNITLKAIAFLVVLGESREVLDDCLVEHQALSEAPETPLQSGIRRSQRALTLGSESLHCLKNTLEKETEALRGEITVLKEALSKAEQQTNEHATKAKFKEMNIEIDRLSKQLQTLQQTGASREALESVVSALEKQSASIRQLQEYLPSNKPQSSREKLNLSGDGDQVQLSIDDIAKHTEKAKAISLHMQSMHDQVSELTSMVAVHEETIMRLQAQVTLLSQHSNQSPTKRFGRGYGGLFSTPPAVVTREEHDALRAELASEQRKRETAEQKIEDMQAQLDAMGAAIQALSPRHGSPSHG